MALSPPEIQERLRAASAHAQSGRHRDAIALLEGMELQGRDLAEACVVRIRAAVARGDGPGHWAATEQLTELADTPRLQLIVLLQHARVARNAGDRDAVLATLEQVRAQARALGDPELQAVAWTLTGDRAHSDGDFGGAERAYHQALALGGPIRRLFVRAALAALATDRGDRALAMAHLQAGLAQTEDAPWPRGMLFLRKGSHHLQHGELDAARACNDQALALLESVQAYGPMRHGYAERGEVLRHSGELHAAAQAFRRSLALGATDEIAEVARLNLALVSVALGDLDQARAQIQAPVHGRLLPYVHAIQASVFAHGREHGPFLDAVNALDPLLHSGAADLDLAASFEDAARRAAGAGWDDHAARLGAGALRSWRRLDRSVDAERVRTLLASLRGCRIPLGPFEVHRPLGAGGVGEVWRGRHRAQDVAVAVKVLHGPAARTPEAHREFVNEIQAVARMNHPHIVRVFDHGRLDEAVDVLSGGRLAQGSPFLIMELAPGGSLAKWCGVLGWSEIRRILLELLDALAHAHARGLIHRDLKPGNILRTGGAGAPVRLTDFGLARGLGAQDQARVVGTPAYMAPEQLSARTLDFGPWTDLYALGCLAWALVTGRPPFLGPVRELVHAQRHDPPPPLEPRCPVPDGLEAWLRVLLAKDPRLRYRCAADAARALLSLEGASGGHAGALHAVPQTTAPNTFFFLDVEPDAAAPAPTCPPEPAHAQAAIPTTWHRDQATPPLPAQLLGVGLELFNLREIAVVGRERERDRLWDALRTEAPRAVVLSGPAGIGKTRLVTWLCHRALELGVADVVDLDCHAGVALGAVRERLSGRLRPVVVTLDQAERSVDALDIARALLRDPPDVPLLVLVTLRPSELLAPEQLDALLQANAELLALEPLDALAQAALIEDLLGLERGVAATVAARAGGNPQFAVELVGDLIQRGVLVPGDAGFRLATGASLEVPDGLHQVWSARIEGIGLSEQDLHVLELAAVLGREGQQDELVRAWPGALPQGLGEQLAGLGLAQLTDTGWHFSQSMLRQSLLRRAKDAGRLEGWHAACAGAVTSDLRRARHLVEAGELQAALPLLMDAVRDPGAPNAVQTSWTLERVLDRLGVAADDPRRGHMLRFRAEALLERSRYDEVVRAAERLLEHSQQPGWETHAARGLACRGRARRALAQYDAAAQDLQAAVARFRDLGDEASAAISLHGLALVDRIQGRTELAGQRIEQALRLLQAHGGTPHSVASAWISYGNTRIAAGEPDRARRAMHRALALAEDMANDLMRATVLSSLAELNRMDGDHQAAQAQYEESIAILRSKGLGRAHVVRINLGILSGDRGDWRSARHTLLDVQRIMARQGRRGLVGVCAGLVLPSCAALDHPDELREQLDTAREILDGLGIAELDVARACEQAAAMVEAGALRQELLDMACSQWARAGRDAEVARIEAGR